jgi:WD40 repeat protein
MLAKLWDWDRGFSCAQVFEGHSHYVMQIALNPKDPSTFATASLDRTVKVWSLGQPMPNLTLEGHEKGVNAVDYYPGGERPYLVSGADDRTARVWDYTTKACVQVRLGGGGLGVVWTDFEHPEASVRAHPFFLPGGAKNPGGKTTKRRRARTAGKKTTPRPLAHRSPAPASPEKKNTTPKNN